MNCSRREQRLRSVKEREGYRARKARARRSNRRSPSSARRPGIVVVKAAEEAEPIHPVVDLEPVE